MRNLLVCGRLDGDPKSIEHLINHAERNGPDAILVTNLWHGSHTIDRMMSSKQKDFYRDVFQAFKQLDLPTFLLPGEHDVPFADFIRLVLMAELDNHQLHCVHATPYVENGVLLIGVGGDLNEVIDTWNDRLRSSRSAVEYYLRGLRRQPVPRSIVMLSTPIAGPVGSAFHTDIAGDMRVASELIHSCHPNLAVVAGETDCRGTERIAGTHVVNPGRLSDGSAALVDLACLDEVEFINAEDSQLVA